MAEPMKYGPVPPLIFDMMLDKVTELMAGQLAETNELPNPKVIVLAYKGESKEDIDVLITDLEELPEDYEEAKRVFANIGVDAVRQSRSPFMAFWEQVGKFENSAEDGEEDVIAIIGMTIDNMLNLSVINYSDVPGGYAPIQARLFYAVPSQDRINSQSVIDADILYHLFSGAKQADKFGPDVQVDVSEDLVKQLFQSNDNSGDNGH